VSKLNQRAAWSAVHAVWPVTCSVRHVNYQSSIIYNMLASPAAACNIGCTQHASHLLLLSLFCGCRLASGC
jgi:hypothetical protein